MTSLPREALRERMENGRCPERQIEGERTGKLRTATYLSVQLLKPLLHPSMSERHEVRRKKTYPRISLRDICLLS